MDKRRFAADFKTARNARGWNMEECGKALKVSHATIGNWENPEDTKNNPLPKRWELIKEVMGIDCQSYCPDQSVTFTGNNSQGIINASNGAMVNAGCTVSSERTVTLDAFEYEIFGLWRQYGNRAMAEKCKRQLQAMAAMSAV
jgi:DNA-binding XRE family transcriptional regulator